uniref:Uncharacterized protein n=1 Tax=Sphaerodactylus townsendi TaxID=933632 RepID=A0ACB8E4F7_9SAUR
MELMETSLGQRAFCPRPEARCIPPEDTHACRYGDPGPEGRGEPRLEAGPGDARRGQQGMDSSGEGRGPGRGGRGQQGMDPCGEGRGQQGMDSSGEGRGRARSGRGQQGMDSSGEGRGGRSGEPSMKLSVAVPSVGLRAADLDRSADRAAHTVFKVDVFFNGRKHSLEKRYSEFHALHKRIKKRCKVPDFPPKRVPNWMAKVMEQRRQGLEAYLQGILLYNTELPRDLLDFLKLWHFQQDPEAWAQMLAFGTEQRVSPSEPTPNAFLSHTGFILLCSSLGDLALQDVSLSYLLSHRPVISYHRDPYVLPSYTDLLPNVILSGVLRGLYAPETGFSLDAKILAGPDQVLPRAVSLP